MEKLQKFITYFKKRKKLPLILVALSIAVVFGWRTFVSKQAAQPQYQIAKVERGTIVSSISTSGQILTANVMNVTTGASGLVRQVFVSDGDKVAKGDKIAEIELDSAGQQRNASAWSSYLSAKNSLDSTNTTLYTLQSDMFTKWKKFNDLAQSSTYQNTDGLPNVANRTLPEFVTVQDDWLAAESKYKNQQNVISQAQAALNNAWLSYRQSSSTITAPMPGTVENITIAPGMTIGGQSMSSTNGQTTSGQTIAVIRNEGNPLALFNFSEIDVSKIKIGQKATVTLDAITDKTFTGKVVSIDKIGQVVSNVTNYPVIVQLDTNSEDLLPNMSTTANVIIETKDNVLFVPSQAIQTVSGQPTVRVLKAGQIQQISIETGISGDNETEVTLGLSKGDEVIVGTTGTSNQQGGVSPFGGFGGGSFGGGALRPGGFGGGSRGGGMQH